MEKMSADSLPRCRLGKPRQMKTPCKTKKFPAFTLIELLVVIGIIATLTAVAMPAISAAMMAGKIARATSDARQVGLTLRQYAQDHSGEFPAGQDINSSNDAFRTLFPDYTQVEAVYAEGPSAVGKLADNKIEPESRILERGENHWAYVAGLNDTSNSLWPLVVDHTDGSGYYTNVEGEKGGTWRGTKAIVVRCDSSAVALRLSGKGAKRFMPRHDDDQKNALTVGEYMGKDVRLLEPEA
jgi:type II secretory pathway pseudopilin PulG